MKYPSNIRMRKDFFSFNVYSIYEYDSLYYQFYTEDGKQKYHMKETTIRGIKIRGVDIDLFYPPERAYSIDYTKKRQHFIDSMRK